MTAPIVRRRSRSFREGAAPRRRPTVGKRQSRQTYQIPTNDGLIARSNVPIQRVRLELQPQTHSAPRERAGHACGEMDSCEQISRRRTMDRNKTRYWLETYDDISGNWLSVSDCETIRDEAEKRFGQLAVQGLRVRLVTVCEQYANPAGEPAPAPRRHLYEVTVERTAPPDS
jgi:hypothetical protein